MKTGVNSMFVAVLTGLHLLFLVIAASTGGIFTLDSYDYLSQANNIREYGSFYSLDADVPVKMDYFTKRPPLFGLLLAGFGSHVWLFIIFQNLLSIFSWIIVAQIAKNHFPEKKVHLFILVGLVLFPNTLLYANMVMSEIFLQSCIVGAIAGAYYYVRDRRQVWLWVSQLAWIAAVFTKPVFLFFWVINALFLCWYFYRHRNWKVLLFIPLLPVLTALWSYRNQQVTGYYQYSSITTVNLKDYNTQYFLAGRKGLAYADSVISGINKAAEKIPVYSARSRFIEDTCKRILFEDPLAYSGFQLKGMLAFLLDGGRFDWVNFLQIRQSEEGGFLAALNSGDYQQVWQLIRKQDIGLVALVGLIVLGNLCLLLLLLSGMFRLYRPWPAVFWLLLAAVVLYVWVLTGPIGSSRFKVPVYPLLVLLALPGIPLHRRTAGR